MKSASLLVSFRVRALYSDARMPPTDLRVHAKGDSDEENKTKRKDESKDLMGTDEVQRKRKKGKNEEFEEKKLENDSDEEKTKENTRVKKELEATDEFKRKKKKGKNEEPGMRRKLEKDSDEEKK